MRVLVLESNRGAADRTIVELEHAGHTVLRCHEPDLSAFPCNALCDDGVCPLEEGPGVDVALDYRAHPYPRPTPFEDGVSCALRHFVPVVVGGTSALNPFDRWTTGIAADADIVEACEQAASASQHRLAQPAARAVLDLRNGPDGWDGAEVLVHRDGTRLKAVVVLPDDAPEIESQVAVAVAGRLRATDRYASGIDVAVRRTVDQA